MMVLSSLWNTHVIKNLKENSGNKYINLPLPSTFIYLCLPYNQYSFEDKLQQPNLCK